MKKRSLNHVVILQLAMNTAFVGAFVAVGYQQGGGLAIAMAAVGFALGFHIGGVSRGWLDRRPEVQER